ncbi:LrgB family protein [Paenibacillus psychroresistens]|uniref:LrgB family protein n=1 Tax=Paenibacillus psychroresistens TaxID=1778678 RepID=A0A6B8RPN9_9BACL|nr:LrgB family protein [Paenibacillus psychroresistens]QGQ97495.1 LrgB family protein [Paenibacillus psychroresistens]
MNYEILNQPLFGVTLSVGAYALGIRLSQKYPRIHPLFVSSLSIVLFLLATDIPYETYKIGGNWLSFLLGPATVALGVPLYKYRNLIKKQLSAILTGVVVGSLMGIVSAGSFIWLLGGSKPLILTMLPKSVSSPIAIELSKLVGGIPELSAVLTVLTGLIGSMLGRSFLQRLGLRESWIIGIATGTAAHGIGTAKLMYSSEIEGSYSAFAMALSGIVTSIFFIPIVWWLQ